MVTQPAGQFSGGEKARLLLAMIVWQKPNLLLLDEPTNHLDLVTREALAVALASFDGAVLLVSHDRALLRAVCEDFWLVGGARVRDFEGDLDDYQRYLLDQARQRREALAASAARTETAPGLSAGEPEKPKPQPALNPAEQRRQDARRRQQKAERLKPLRQAIGKIDQRLAELATERAALEQRLAQPALAPADIASGGRQLKTVTEETARLEDQWLDLSGQIEAMEQAQE
jgi:ATP-binding cassette subfamily F protein 3